MKLDDYQTVFMAISLILMLVAASPALSAFIRIPKVSQQFSEIWILGPNRTFEDYPFQIRANQLYTTYVGVGNHMGASSYYLIYVKFRNQTQPLPDSNTSTPSPLQSIYEFRFFLADGEDWETTVNFVILDAHVQDNSVVVKQISINDITVNVNYTGQRYCQMFFELWRYDLASDSFQYHNRFASIWFQISV